MAIDFLQSLQRLSKYEQPYLGLAEIGEIIGQTKQNTSNMRVRRTLPEPLVNLAIGPIWSASQIRMWLVSRVL